MLMSHYVVQTPSEAIWNQSDGWADTERHHSILCLCDRKTESALSQHIVLKGKQTFPPRSALDSTGILPVFHLYYSKASLAYYIWLTVLS